VLVMQILPDNKCSHAYRINDTTELYTLMSDCILLSTSDLAKQMENKNFAMMMMMMMTTMIIIIIIEKLRKYIDFREKLIRKWQLKRPI
jgi:hypothetical protein